MLPFAILDGETIFRPIDLDLPLAQALLRGLGAISLTLVVIMLTILLGRRSWSRSAAVALLALGAVHALGLIGGLATGGFEEGHLTRGTGPWVALAGYLLILLSGLTGLARTEDALVPNEGNAAVEAPSA
jgi:hypothetical protein